MGGRPGRTAGRLTAIPQIPVTDAGEATIIPGLVDGHMHISFGEPRTEEELFIYTPAPYRAIRAAIDAEKVLLAGVTAACDPGGPNGVAPAVARRHRRRPGAGPEAVGGRPPDHHATRHR